MLDSFEKNYVIKLVDLGLLQVTGRKSKEFLQGQLTCDVTEINDTQSRLGAHCDIKGRIHATFRLFLHEGSYYFLMPHSMVSPLKESLEKYAVFSAVKLTDVTQHWEIIGVGGSSVDVLLKQQGLFPEKNNGVTYSSTTISLAMPDLSRFVLLKPESICFLDNTFIRAPINNWYLSDVKAGIPSIYPQTTTQFTPQQLNYPAINGVSFNKGCYIGQEIIARTHYLGKPKSRLYRVAFQTNRHFFPGSVLQNKKHTHQGTLLMAAKEKDNHYQALVCLQNSAISNTIHIEGPQGPILNILELPYKL